MFEKHFFKDVFQVRLFIWNHCLFGSPLHSFSSHSSDRSHSKNLNMSCAELRL